MATYCQLANPSVFVESNSGASPRGFTPLRGDEFVAQSGAMTERNVVLSTLFIVLAAARSTAAQSVIEKEKFDVEKARMYVATVQPHRPVLAPNGHTRNRVFIYMDDGVMTRREGNAPAKTLVFHRGDDGRPGSYSHCGLERHTVRSCASDQA